MPIDAPQRLIKQAYRRLAMTLHPDVNEGDPGASHRFRELKEAYEALVNPQLRAERRHERALDDCFKAAHELDRVPSVDTFWSFHRSYEQCQPRPRQQVAAMLGSALDTLLLRQLANPAPGVPAALLELRAELGLSKGIDHQLEQRLGDRTLLAHLAPRA